MAWQPSTKIKNDPWFWRWVFNREPIDNDPRGNLIKLVQKLNATTGTRPGKLPSIPDDLSEHREAVERLWEQYNREQEDIKASQARGPLDIGSEESLRVLEKAFDPKYEDDVPPDKYL